MCRRELDKSESEIKKNGSIIGEYKQVCIVCLLYAYNWIVTLAGLIIVFPLSYMWCKLKSGNCHTTVFITVLLKLILEKQTYFSLCFPFSSSFKTTSLLPTLTDRWIIVHIHSPAFIYYYRYILLVPLRPSFLFRANVIRHCIVAGNSPQRFWSILAR